MLGPVRQIEAAKYAATFSTGPITAEGKAIASQNALSHGIFSQRALVHGESAEEWDEFHNAVITDLAPEGFFTAEIAARIANTLWRLRRVQRYETAASNLTHGQFCMRALSDISRSYPLERAEEMAVLPSQLHLKKIAKYEAHLSRCLHRDWQIYRELNESRRGRVKLSMKHVVVHKPNLSAQLPAGLKSPE